VNAICPGFVESSIMATGPGFYNVTKEQYLASVTAKVPLGHIQTADDIGNAAAFLCSDMAVNITGQALNVDGGLHMN